MQLARPPSLKMERYKRGKEDARDASPRNGELTEVTSDDEPTE